MTKKFPDGVDVGAGAGAGAGAGKGVRSGNGAVAGTAAASVPVSVFGSAPSSTPANPFAAPSSSSSSSSASTSAPAAANPFGSSAGPKMDFSGKVNTDQPLFQAKKTVNPFASALAEAPATAPVASAVAPAPMSGFGFGGGGTNPFAPSASAGTGTGIDAGAAPTEANPFARTDNPFAAFGTSFKPVPTSFAGTELPSAAAAGGAADDDDGAEPELEPEKVGKNDKDKSIMVEFEAKSKLMRLNDSGDEWLDCGKGNMSVVQDTDGAKKKRVIVRNQMGNIMVNSYFFKQQKFSELKNKGGVTNGIKFTCMMDVKGEMKMRHFITKLKPEDAPTMLAKCQEAAAAVS